MEANPYLRWALRAAVLLFVLAAIALALVVTDALATPAERLATSAGITVEQAEKDLAAQQNTPNVVERLQGALGANYAGVWFNIKTGRFMIPLAPGALKAQAKAAVGASPAAFPLAKYTLAELDARRDALSAELAPLVAEGKAQVAIYEQGNTVRVIYASTLSTEQKTAIKAKASAVAGGKTLIAQAQVCTFPYCEDQAVGGVRINGPVTAWAGPRIACSAGFIVHGLNADMLLTAGHCIDHAVAHGESYWQPRENWHCLMPPGGACEPVAPWPPSGECLLHNAQWELDEGGDFGLLSLENCGFERRVATWFGEQESVMVEYFSHPIFNCMEPGCNTPIPASEQAYPGLFQCHYGLNAQYEQPLQNCGLVKYVDMAVTIAYEQMITVGHLDAVCAMGIPGDSGSPFIAPARSGHGIATGIHVASSPGEETKACGKTSKGTAYSQEIGPALDALGVRFGP